MDGLIDLHIDILRVVLKRLTAMERGRHPPVPPL